MLNVPIAVPHLYEWHCAGRSYEDLEDILYRAHGGDMFAAEKAFDALQVCLRASHTCQSGL